MEQFTVANSADKSWNRFVVIVKMWQNVHKSRNHVKIYWDILLHNVCMHDISVVRWNSWSAALIQNAINYRSLWQFLLPRIHRFIYFVSSVLSTHTNSNCLVKYHKWNSRHCAVKNGEYFITFRSTWATRFQNVEFSLKKRQCRSALAICKV